MLICIENSLPEVIVPLEQEYVLPSAEQEGNHLMSCSSRPLQVKTVPKKQDGPV